jgi:hypothetical protein
MLMIAWGAVQPGRLRKLGNVLMLLVRDGPLVRAKSSQGI